MEYYSKLSPLLFQFLQLIPALCFLISFFIATTCFCLLLLLHLRRKKLLCRCDICYSYLSSSWSKDFNNLCDWYTHLLQKSPTQTVQVHVLDNIVTSNPDNVEYILKSRFDNYPKGKSFSLILGDLLGKGIFNVDGDLWLFQRKIASLELATTSIRNYAFEVVSNEIKSRLFPLLSSIASKQKEDDDDCIVDLQDIFRRFSFDNICKFSFGLDPFYLESSLPISLFANSMDIATKVSAERAMVALPLVWKIKRLFNIGTERKLKHAIKVVNTLAMDVISQKRKLGFLSHQDLLSRFMNCINDDNYLRDIVISFILAGRDTMASALTTFFLLLAQHPQVVYKIRKEAMMTSNHESSFPSYDQIREMHYLHAAVYESLRIYPPVQFDSKFALEDDTLPDGSFVKKGTRVTYHPYAMGRMENIWGQDFMEFKPERWLKDGNFCPQNSYKYPVFQAGARACLGKELALMEMKIVAVSALSKFDFEVVEQEDAPRFEIGLTAMVKDGLKVMVKESKCENES